MVIRFLCAPLRFFCPCVGLTAGLSLHLMTDTPVGMQSGRDNRCRDENHTCGSERMIDLETGRWRDSVRKKASRIIHGGRGNGNVAINIGGKNR